MGVERSAPLSPGRLMLGGRELSPPENAERMKGAKFHLKPSREVKSHPRNVALVMGKATALAAGATATLTVNTPRDLILRRLFAQEEGGSFDFAIAGVEIEGDKFVLGPAPGVAASAVHPNTRNPLEFDYIVPGGIPVTVQVTNTSAAAIDVQVWFTID